VIGKQIAFIHPSCLSNELMYTESYLSFSLRIVVITNPKAFLGTSVRDLRIYVDNNHLNDIIIDVVPRSPGSPESGLADIILPGGFKTSPEELVALHLKTMYAKLKLVPNRTADFRHGLRNLSLIMGTVPDGAGFAYKQAFFTTLTIANLGNDDDEDLPAPIELVSESLAGLILCEYDGLLNVTDTSENTVLFGDVGAFSVDCVVAERKRQPGLSPGSPGSVHLKVIEHADKSNLGGNAVDKLIQDHIIEITSSDDIIRGHSWRENVPKTTPDWAMKSLIHLIQFTMGQSEASAFRENMKVSDIILITFLK